MKAIQTIAFSACLFLLCFNGACDKNDSVTGSYQPDVNVYGTITDVDGKERTVEDITLSGNYKDIRVFPKPQDPAKFSTDNYERIDLAETKEIRPHHAYKLNHKGIEYIEIEVTHNDGTTDSYMISKNKYVQANRIAASGPIAKVLTIDQLKSLVIKGYVLPKKENSKEKND